jgi:hypothetical protein
MANILILRNVPNGDDHVKSGFSKTEKLQNGYAVSLGEVSTDRKTRNAFELDAPKADTPIAIVYNADVPVVTDDRGNSYKAITHDPRDIVFTVGTVVDLHIPGALEEIAMTEIDGTADSATHVVYKEGSMKPTYATSTDDAVLAYKITGTKFVSIGSERVPTVELMRV